MNAMALNNLLVRLEGCEEGVEYAQGKTFREAWDACERPDWMLWFAGKAGADRKRLVMAACDCARTSLSYVAEGDAGPSIAIETAERWCRGEAGIDEVRDATPCAAYAAAYAADAAAAHVAVDTAAAAAAYAAAATAVATANNAVDTVAAAAIYAAYVAAAAGVAMAPLVREHLDADYMEGLLEAAIAE